MRSGRARGARGRGTRSERERARRGARYSTDSISHMI